MHIPNMVLDPGVALATGAVGAAGLALGLRRLERRFGERSAVLLGTTAAFVFAAQMVNFPLGPFGVSGHLLGGVLAAMLLGPWAGMVVIAAVLVVQCFLFGDGGLTALGANFVNMGLIGSGVGYAIYAPIRRAIGGRAGVLLGAMLAAWFSVLLAAGAFSVELAGVGRWGNFGRVLSWMGLVHAVIGVGEAVITGLVVRFVLQTRPDLIYDPEATDETPPGRGRLAGVLGAAGGGLAVALAVALFLAPFASEHPDGLEFVGQRLGFLGAGEGAAVPLRAPLADYEFPGLAGVSLRAATAAAGATGTLIVFAFGLVLAGAFARRPEGTLRGGADGVAPDAA